MIGLRVVTQKAQTEVDATKPGSDLIFKSRNHLSSDGTRNSFMLFASKSKSEAPSTTTIGTMESLYGGSGSPEPQEAEGEGKRAQKYVDKEDV